MFSRLMTLDNNNNHHNHNTNISIHQYGVTTVPSEQWKNFFKMFLNMILIIFDRNVAYLCQRISPPLNSSGYLKISRNFDRKQKTAICYLVSLKLSLFGHFPFINTSIFLCLIIVLSSFCEKAPLTRGSCGTSPVEITSRMCQTRHVQC